MKQSGTCENNILLGANFSSHVKYLCEFISKEKHFCLSPNVMRNILLNLNNIFDIESKLQIVLTRERPNPEKPLLGSIIMRLLLKIVVFYGAVWELGPFSPNTRDLCRPEPPRIGSPLEGGDLGEGDRDHRGDVATASPPKAGTATRLGPQARLRGGAGRSGARRGAARGARSRRHAGPAPSRAPAELRRGAGGGGTRRVLLSPRRGPTPCPSPSANQTPRGAGAPRLPDGPTPSCGRVPAAWGGVAWALCV